MHNHMAYGGIQFSEPWFEDLQYTDIKASFKTEYHYFIFSFGQGFP